MGACESATYNRVGTPDQGQIVSRAAWFGNALSIGGWDPYDRDTILVECFAAASPIRPRSQKPSDRKWEGIVRGRGLFGQKKVPNASVEL